MVNLKKIMMYIIIFVLLFQESIQRIMPFKIIDYFDEIFVLIIVAMAMAKVLRTKKLPKQIIILGILLFLFFLFGSVSLYLNSSHEFSKYVASSFLAIKCFLLIISVSIIDFSDSTKKQFIDIINKIGILCAVIGIFNFIFPSIYAKLFPFGIITYRFGFVSVTSLFYHPGRFGWFMLLLAIVNYVLYKKNKNKKNRNMFIIYGLLSLLSFRTKVILSIIILLAYNITLSRKIDIRKVIIASMAGLFIFITFNNVIMDTYYLYFDDNNVNVSARQSLTNNSIKIMKEYFPLGVGFGKYGSWYARKYYSEYYYKYNMTRVYGLSPNDAFFATDTFWGSIFGETGFIGTTFYISFLLYIVLHLKNKVKQKKEGNSIYIYLGLLVLVQSIIESFGEQSFNSPPQYLFLGIMVGVAINEAIKLDLLRCETK